MLRLHLQPKLKTKLATHNWIMVKMIILLKYVKKMQYGKRIIENKAQLWIWGVKVGGPLFIDTMDKQWPSNKNNLDAQDCPMW